MTRAALPQADLQGQALTFFVSPFRLNPRLQANESRVSGLLKQYKKQKPQTELWLLLGLVGRPRFEPRTNGLKVDLTSCLVYNMPVCARQPR
jgi:hypothetical protein